MEAHKEEHTPSQIRVNRGYKLREDLIKACKRVALETDRTLYAVMEEALEDLKRKYEAISRGNYVLQPPSLPHEEASSANDLPEPEPEPEPNPNGTPFPDY